MKREISSWYVKNRDIYSMMLRRMRNGTVKITNAFNLIKFDEGQRPTPYQCTSKKWTIGVGHNLEANPLTGEELKYLLDTHNIKITLTEAGSDFLLLKKFEAIKVQLNDYKFYNDLSDVRKAVIINMAYAMGVHGVMKFKNMLEAIEEENWENAQSELEDSKFHRNLKTLDSKRSDRLSLMMLTDAWPVC